MGTRTNILAALAREVLGPRDGPREIMSDDPREEYVTGVLAPALDPTASTDRDVDADAEVIGESIGDEAEAEDDADAGPEPTAYPVSPSLDPKSLPRSIGLSFIVEGREPIIRVCCTWARYQQAATGWQRSPAHMISQGLPGSKDNRLGPTDDVGVQIRSRRINPTTHRVSVFLVNERSVRPPSRPATPDLYFSRKSGWP
jgi:hypothetical protein